MVIVNYDDYIANTGGTDVLKEYKITFHSKDCVPVINIKCLGLCEGHTVLKSPL